MKSAKQLEIADVEFLINKEFPLILTLYSKRKGLRIGQAEIES